MDPYLYIYLLDGFRTAKSFMKKEGFRKSPPQYFKFCQPNVTDHAEDLVILCQIWDKYDTIPIAYGC